VDINDTKFWESVGFVVICFVFIAGVGIALFQVGKLSFDKVSVENIFNNSFFINYIVS